MNLAIPWNVLVLNALLVNVQYHLCANIVFLIVSPPLNKLKHVLELEPEVELSVSARVATANSVEQTVQLLDEIAHLQSIQLIHGPSDHSTVLSFLSIFCLFCDAQQAR